MCLGSVYGSLLGVGLEMGVAVREALLVNVMDRKMHVAVCQAWLAAWRRALALVRYRGAGISSSSSKLSNLLTPKMGSRVHPRRSYTASYHPRRWYSNGSHPWSSIPVGMM
jgi:hypothetical protein